LTVFLDFLMVIVGFVCLIKGADFLVDSASSIAKKLNISELVIGLTIVALGTSAPEMVVNGISAAKGHDEVVFGNIIGSNIFNLFLILGVAGLIYPLSVRGNTVWKEIPFSLGVSVFLFLLVNDQLLWGNDYNTAGKFDGVFLIGLFVAFILYIAFNLRKDKDRNELVDEHEIKIFSYTKTILMMVGGIAALAIGGNLVVTNAVALAQKFEVSEKLIGLTIISAGTSLPELATTVIAATKKKSDIAVGNVLGSNILNITLILGISALIRPLNYNVLLNTDMYVLFGGTLLLFFFMFTLHSKKLDRWEAFIYVVGFIGYLVFLFIRK